MLFDFKISGLDYFLLACPCQSKLLFKGAFYKGNRAREKSSAFSRVGFKATAVAYLCTFDYKSEKRIEKALPYNEQQAGS